MQETATQKTSRLMHEVLKMGEEQAQISIVITFESCQGRKYVQRKYSYTGKESNLRKLYGAVLKAMGEQEDGQL